MFKIDSPTVNWWVFGIALTMALLGLNVSVSAQSDAFQFVAQSPQEYGHFCNCPNEGESKTATFHLADGVPVTVQYRQEFCPGYKWWSAESSIVFHFEKISFPGSLGVDPYANKSMCLVLFEIKMEFLGNNIPEIENLNMCGPPPNGNRVFIKHNSCWKRDVVYNDGCYVEYVPCESSVCCLSIFCLKIVNYNVIKLRLQHRGISEEVSCDIYNVGVPSSDPQCEDACCSY